MNLFQQILKAFRQGAAAPIAAALFGLTVVSGCASIPQAAQELVGAPSPETRFFIAGTEHVALSHFKGSWVVLGFWDTRCPRSRKLIHELNDFAKSSKGRHGRVFLAVSIDEASDKEEWREVVAGLPHLRHAFSGNGALDEAFMMYKLDAIPVLVVINPRGEVVGISPDIDIVESYVGNTVISK